MSAISFIALSLALYFPQYLAFTSPSTRAFLLILLVALNIHSWRGQKSHLLLIATHEIHDNHYYHREITQAASTKLDDEIEIFIEFHLRTCNEIVL